MTDILVSELDASVNFVTPTKDGGAFEARFVQRGPEYFIVYLSSHTGCDRACRMCHLTQTGQTMMTPASHNDYMVQAVQVLDRWVNTPLVETPKFVNYNFMARGEPFANPTVTDGGFVRLRDRLETEARRRGIDRSQMNLSTIMPETLVGADLVDMLGPRAGTNIYYSLYSMQSRFRKRWLPKAMDPRRALDMLVDYQQAGDGAEVVLHWTFMEGENDDLETLEEIIDAVISAGLKTRFNLVRYNAFSPKQGREPEDAILLRNLNILAGAFNERGAAPSKIVSRVGMDVKASCGMFVAPDQLQEPA